MNPFREKPRVLKTNPRPLGVDYRSLRLNPRALGINYRSIRDIPIEVLKLKLEDLPRIITRGENLLET